MFTKIAVMLLKQILSSLVEKHLLPPLAELIRKESKRWFAKLKHWLNKLLK